MLCARVCVWTIHLIRVRECCTLASAMEAAGCDTSCVCSNSSCCEAQRADTAQLLSPRRTRPKRFHNAWLIPINANFRMFLYRHGFTTQACPVPASSKKEAFQAPSTQPCQTQQSLLETTWQPPMSLF